MQAQVVRASLHVRCGKGNAEGYAERRDVLEEDLLLQIFCAGGYENALPAEDGRNEIGERLTGAGACLGQKDSALFETAGDPVGHLHLTVPRFELPERAGEGAIRRERLRYEFTQC